jgi:hypothetical protein
VKSHFSHAWVYALFLLSCLLPGISRPQGRWSALWYVHYTQSSYSCDDVLSPLRSLRHQKCWQVVQVSVVNHVSCVTRNIEKCLLMDGWMGVLAIHASSHVPPVARDDSCDGRLALVALT